MNARRRAFFLISMVALLLLARGLPVPNAVAHAELTTSTPSPGSAESTAPDHIELQFSETIELSLSSIGLLASDGTPVQLAPVTLNADDPHIMSTDIVAPDAMSSGVYTVVWGAYSAQDGHASSGSFTFSIGTGESPAQLGAGNAKVPAWSIAGKWLELIGLLLLAGLAFFAITAGAPVVPISPVLHRTIALLTVIALVGTVVSFQARVVAVSGHGMLSGVHGETASDLLRSTYGQAWVARIVALVIALLAVWLLVRSAPNRGLSIVVACAIGGLATIALSGHAAAVHPSWLAISFDLLHMSAAALWLGGLLGLLLVISPDVALPEDRALLKSQGNRFAAAVALIIIAGLAAAYWHVGGRRSLQTTDYGRTLLVKVATVAVLLGLAYYNRRVLQSERGRPRWVPIAIGAELVLAIVILLFSADLSQTPPATQPLTVQVAARAIDLAEEATAGATTVHLSGILTGDPTDEIFLSISPATDLQRVIVRSSLLASGKTATVGDRFDAAPVDDQPGSYRFPAGKLGIAGSWDLEITVRRAGVVDEIVTLPIDTSDLATYGTSTIQDQWGGFRLTSHTALALVLAALMVAIGLGGLRRITGLEPLASGFLLAASIVIAGGFLISAARGLVPVTPDHVTPNPLQSSASVLTYAGNLYQLNCAICHGVNGRGAGSSNLAHLHGSAADLTTTGAESQSDGDLRYWIANGIGGTRMPAFNPALTEDEQWQLVIFIRQLQQQARDADAAE